MQHYDYTYLTRQDMSEDDAKKLQDKLVALIIAKNGAITDLPKSYKKRLAYRIKKQDTAFVNTVLFTAQADAIVDFKKETDILSEILRGLIISYDPEKLKREIRPEIGRNNEKSVSAEATIADKPVAQIIEEEPVKSSEKPVAEKEEVKEAAKTKEEKKEIREKEKDEEKPSVESKKEEAKEETKTTKPKRKTKIKTELKDIEQKLDEILK